MDLEKELDEAFDLMQSLMDQLPKMQALQKEILQAEKAAQAERLETAYRNNQKKEDAAEEDLRANAREISRLKAQDPSAAELESLKDRQELGMEMMRMRQESLMGYRNRYLEKVKALGFASEKEYLAAKRPQEERAAMKKRLEDYQKKYSEVYERCQSLSAQADALEQK